MQNAYITIHEMRDYVSINDAIDNPVLEIAIEAASRAVDEMCHRRFWSDTDISTRVFSPLDCHSVLTDDFIYGDDVSVATDSDGDGIYETAWDSSDYDIAPENINADTHPGTGLVVALTGALLFTQARKSVAVTARWGWPVVPAPVKLATTILASDLYKSKETKFGIVDLNEYGPLRIRDNATVKTLLNPYRRAGGFA